MESLSNFILVVFLAIFEIYARGVILVTALFPRLIKAIVDYIFKKRFDITINGPQPTDIKVLKPEKFYARVAAYFDLGLIKSIINEECNSDDPVGAFTKILRGRNFKHLMHPVRYLTSRLNLQTGSNIWKVGIEHYDIGNDLYEAMLDPHMQYTCAYWRNASNLNEAQLAKMDLIAAKLYLKPGMRVLDLGCGFGTLACYLAKNYGVSVVGCTISKEQLKYGQVAAEGLPVELRLCDYRDMDEKFDRVVSIGLMEHVGPKNYIALMQVAHRCLIDDGLCLLHTLGCNHKSVPCTAASANKYIFPNSQIPYYLTIARAMEGLWVIEDWHNFGYDYSKTLKAWEENFDSAWPTLRKNYDQRFYTLWKFYLLMARGLLLSRTFQLWQIVLSKDGLKGGYVSVR